MVVWVPLWKLRAIASGSLQPPVQAEQTHIIVLLCGHSLHALHAPHMKPLGLYLLVIPAAMCTGTFCFHVHRSVHKHHDDIAHL